MTRPTAVSAALININTAKWIPVVASTAKTIGSAVDLHAEGTFSGESNFDLDPNIPEEKPGAGITDYCNYGVTEETWRRYCDTRMIAVLTEGSEATLRKDGSSSTQCLLRAVHTVEIVVNAVSCLSFKIFVGVDYQKSQHHEIDIEGFSG